MGPKSLCTKKWPNQSFPTVNFVFPTMVPLLSGGGGGKGPPMVVSRSTTSPSTVSRPKLNKGKRKAPKFPTPSQGLQSKDLGFGAIQEPPSTSEQATAEGTGHFSAAGYRFLFDLT